MIQYKRESNEVLYDKSELTILNNKDLNLLSKKAKLNKKKIIRLCVHKSKKDKVHQLIMSFCKRYEELCQKKYPEAPLPLEILKSIN